MKVDQEVLSVLSLLEINGNQVKITSQLERKLYERTNKVLEAAGGKWNTKAKAHIFPGDAEEALDQVINTGVIAIHQEMGSFFTPEIIVDLLIELAHIQPGMLVLEPSAGIGNIVKKLLSATDNVSCIEIDQKHCDQLRKNCGNVNLLCTDFLTFPAVPLFDRVVMNPPFAKQADIDHVIHALKFVKPGGRLVSVMSAGIYFRENKKTIGFRELMTEHGGILQRLPEGAFKESGTMVNTVIVEIPN
ncbi:MAG: rRNA adenine N-6-methyltransferase family protein [Clostridia bacterium]|jgi:predicted RNA methylase